MANKEVIEVKVDTTGMKLAKTGLRIGVIGILGGIIYRIGKTTVNSVRKDFFPPKTGK